MVSKKEFVEELAKKSGITKVEALQRTEDFLSVMTDCLKEKKGVSFRGILTLKAVTRKGRKGSVNGHSYETKDSVSVKAVAGNDLLETLN